VAAQAERREDEDRANAAVMTPARRMDKVTGMPRSMESSAEA